MCVCGGGGGGGARGVSMYIYNLTSIFKSECVTLRF